MIRSSIYIAGAVLFTVTIGACDGEPPPAQPAAVEAPASTTAVDPLNTLLASRRRIRILPSGAMLAEVKPCGCSNPPLGGVARRLTIQEQIRRRPVPETIAIDIGDNFFPRPSPVSANVPELLSSKARIAAAYLRLANPHGSGLGEFDLLHGPHAVASAIGSEATFVISNMGHADLRLRPWTVIETSAGKILFLNFLPPETRRYAGLTAQGFVEEPIPSVMDRLRAQIADGRIAPPALLVIGWHDQPVAASTRGVELPGVPRIVLVGNHLSDLDEARVIEGTLVIGCRSYGLSQQILDVYLHPEGATTWSDGRRYAMLKRLVPRDTTEGGSVAARPQIEDSLSKELQALRSSNVFLFESKPLTSEVASHPELESMIRALEETPLAPVDNPLAFKGAAHCATCHLKESANWTKTHHHEAFTRLESRDADRNPSCLQCHVSGFGYPYGPRTLEQLEPFRGVQCESCHLPTGRNHPEDSGSFVPVSPATCVLCHTRSQSPEFDFDSYLRQASCQTPHLSPHDKDN